MSSTTHCAQCGGPATKRCSRCNNVHYCAVTCQRADWHVHRSVCSAVVDATPRPSDKHRRAILLPETGGRPQFVWIATEGDDTDEDEAESADVEDEVGNAEDGDVFVEQPAITTAASAEDAKPETGTDEQDSDASSDASDVTEDEEFAPDLGVPLFDRADVKEATPEFGTLLGDEDEMWGSVILVVGKMGHGEHLDHSIHLCHKDDFVGCPRNRCADLLTKGEAGRFWKGPLVLYGMTKVQDSRATVDLHPSDLTLALKGLVEHGKKSYGGLAYFMNGLSL